MSNVRVAQIKDKIEYTFVFTVGILLSTGLWLLFVSWASILNNLIDSFIL